MILIPGEPEAKKEPLLCSKLYAKELASLLEQHEGIRVAFRVGELRKSCGVESELSTVTIRRPPVYSK